MPNPTNTEAKQIPAPKDPSDHNAMREYGQQLALHELLRAAAQNKANKKVTPFTKNSLKIKIAAIAACLTALISFTFWKSSQQPTPSAITLATLDPSWILKPSLDAQFKITNPNTISLLKGELRLTSSKPSNITIKTPNATATASGTDFLIGSHEHNFTTNLNGEPKKNKPMKKQLLTRLLVLAGSVTLANNLGAQTAQKNEAIFAEQGASPEKIIVKANSDFAIKLYQKFNDQIGLEENLIFSPYSLSNALLMVTEGARGQTAQELGQALGFPPELSRIGSDNQNLPWQMSTIRNGFKSLQDNLKNNSNESHNLRKKIDNLKRKIDSFDQNSTQSETIKHNQRVAQYNSLNTKLDETKLNIANSIWAGQNLPIKAPWKHQITTTYGVESIQQCDFEKQPEAERQKINNWVTKQTQGQINNLIASGAIDESTRSVIVNAIAFQSTWAKPFHPGLIKPHPFSLVSGKTKQVTLMESRSDQTIRYAAFNEDGSTFHTPLEIPIKGTLPATYPDENGFAMIQKPYKGNKFSMIALSPNDPSKFHQLQSKINASNLTKWTNELQNRSTHVLIPRFTIESEPKTKKALTSLGIQQMFDSTKANLSGISEGVDYPNYISDIIHKAKINVNAKGTIAAAATIIAKEPVDSAPFEVAARPFTPTFRADRPFIFLIKENKTGTILFLGHVADPTKL